MKVFINLKKESEQKKERKSNMEDIVKEIDYKKEYERLKEVEKGNQELKETIINMSKFMFLRDNALTEIIVKIEKELRTISKRK